MKKAHLMCVPLLLIAGTCVHAKQGPAIKSLSGVDSITQAKLHPIVSSRPAINFFEGALLGNGGLGAIVTTRPDAVVIHFGHNDVWGIRIVENNKDKIGMFQQVFVKVKGVPDSVGSLNDVQ